MNRAYATLEFRAVDDEQRIIEGIASSNALDDYDTILEPKGATYSLPIPLLWQHQSDIPVGTVTTLSANSKRITFRAQLARITEPGTLKDDVDRAWHAVKYGLVKGVSVGFKPLETAGGTSHSDPLRFVKWVLRELSLVSLPANTDATIQAIRSADTAVLAQAASGQGAPRQGPGAQPNRSGTPMTIQEQITQHENSRAAKVARQNALMERAGTDGATLDETQQEEFDTLGGEISSHDGHLVRLRSLQEANARAAVPVVASSTETASQTRGGIVQSVKLRAHSDPGIPMARLVRAVGIAHRKHRDLDTVVRELYPDDTLVQRAAVAAHNTTTDSALVSDEGGVYADFVEYLRPQTIIGKFGTNGIPSLRTVPFRTPLITQTGAGAGYWVGEGAAKPVTKFTWTRTTIDPVKVANIAVITDELLRSSSPAADRMIRDALVEALRERLDTDFIDPAKAASAGVSPASITNAATPIASSEATASTYVDGDVVSVDVQAAMAAFIAANNPPTTGVWIMSATRALALSLMRNALGQFENPNLSMAGGTFAGLPVIVSEYLDPLLVVLANASDIYLADEGGFQVDASTEASLQMDNAPTNNSVTPTATTLVSMFQTNSVAIRAERIINWALRRASAVQVIEDAYWGATTPGA